MRNEERRIIPKEEWTLSAHRKKSDSAGKYLRFLCILVAPRVSLNKTSTWFSFRFYSFAVDFHCWGRSFWNRQAFIGYRAQLTSWTFLLDIFHGWRKSTCRESSLFNQKCKYSSLKRPSWSSAFQRQFKPDIRSNEAKRQTQNSDYSSNK